MSATDELRRLLDELGVEWHESNEQGATFWNGQYGIGYYAKANDDGETLRILGVNLTPEQAIAATLGSGTCEIKELDTLTQTLSMANFCAWGECSAYGCLTPDDSQYCLNCGRKVVER